MLQIWDSKPAKLATLKGPLAYMAELCTTVPEPEGPHALARFEGLIASVQHYVRRVTHDAPYDASHSYAWLATSASTLRPPQATGSAELIPLRENCSLSVPMIGHE